MKLTAVLLALPLLLTLAPLAHAEKVELQSFDVINLEFYVKNPKAKVRDYGPTFEVGRIEMKADIKNNRIQTFNVSVTADRAGSLYDYSAELNELRGKTISLKSHGISLGQLQGVNMTADGEGTLKFIPPASLVGPGLPKSIELTLKRVGQKKNWVVLYQSKVLRTAKIELNKNPWEMSTWSLVMSTPKFISMQTEFLSCDESSVSSVLLNYEAPELLKVAKCDFRNAKANQVYDIVSTLSGFLNVYEGYYGKGISPTVQQNKMLWALDVLKDFGFQMSKDNISFFDKENGSTFDVFETLVKNGQEEVLKNLLASGLKPTVSAGTHEQAVMNVYQMNIKTLEVGESAIGRRILDLVRPTLAKRGTAADLILVLTGYQGSPTQTLASMSSDLEHEKSEMLPANYNLLQKIVSLMIDEGFDLQAGDSSWGYSPLYWLKDRGDDDNQFITKQNSRALVQQLQAAGAK